jgi:hypothetical protein
MNRESRKPVQTSRQKFNHFNSRFMKKISVFLTAALLVGVASAFTTVKPVKQQVAYGFDGSTWHEVNSEDINITFRCDAGASYCLFDEENGSPLEGQLPNRQFVKLP